MEERSESLIDAIVRAVPALLSGAPAVLRVDPVARGEGHHPGVWRIIAEDGSKLVVKHQMFAPFTQGKPYDLLDVEETVCGLLHADGCPVPRVYGVRADCHLIFFEWCGDCTLDDLCQESEGPVRAACAGRAVDGFAAIQSALCAHTPALSHRVFPGCDPAGLLETWGETIGGVEGALPDLAAHLNASLSPRALVRLRRLLPDLLRRLGQAPPLLGPTDYNARNIVIHPDTGDLRFIEFSKLGWDWPERRLMQYATSLGAGRPDGAFRCLLDRHAAARYAARAAEYQEASPEGIARRLDGHHLIFHLLAGRMLLAALSGPSGGRSAHLLRIWRNPAVRLRQLLHALSTSLSDDPLTCELRSLFSVEETG